MIRIPLGGWFKGYQIAFYIVCTIIIVLLSLSHQSTAKIGFYIQYISIPWIFLILEIVVLYITGGPGVGWSIFPFGSHDEDTYPLQKMFGYNGAFLVALVCGILLSAFFYYTVIATGEVWIPVPRLLTRGLQTISTGVRDLFSGRDPIGNAVADSIPATFIENPLFIYSIMLLTWIPVRLIFKYLLGLEEVGNHLGLISWIVASAILFPFIAHAWAYQESEPAYMKAFVFVISNCIVTGLTGFPLPLDMAHIAHNWAGSYYSVVSYGIVIPFVMAGCFLLVNTKSIKYLNTGKLKMFLGNMFKPFGVGVIVFLLLITSVSALDWWRVLFGRFTLQAESEGWNLGEQYPYPLNTKLYRPVYGHLVCKKTDGRTATERVTLYEKDLKWWIFSTGSYATGTYTCDSLGDCRIYNIAVQCPDAGFGSWKATPEYTYEITVGGMTYTPGTWATPGQIFNIKVWCNYEGITLEPRRSPTKYEFDIQSEETKMWFESYGYAYTGWIQGSAECVINSESAEVIKKVQKPADANKIMQKQYTLGGEVPQIIIAWEEAPAYGNINPLGQYCPSGIFAGGCQDVLCSAYQGLYKLNRVGTYGGYTYMTQGDLLVSYSTQPKLCCANSQCQAQPGNLVACENYICTSTPTCGEGPCPLGVVQCGANGGSEEPYTSGGKFYVKAWSCGADKCCHASTREVKCTPAYCDAMSSAGKKFICKFDEGCIEDIYLKTCPNGMCCLEGGQYQVQPCAMNMKCCPSENDIYIGMCKDECEVVPTHCGNGMCEAWLGEDLTTCPEDCGQGDCYKLCEANVPLWDKFMKISTWGCKFQCWLKEKMGELVVALILIIMFSVGLGLRGLFVPGVIIGVILALITVFVSFWFGLAMVIIGMLVIIAMTMVM